MEIKNYIHIDFTRGKDIVVPSIQYDSGTRWVMAKLYDNGLPIDLQELKVCIVAVKPEGKEIFNECKIIDAEKGIIEFEITKQMGILVGEVECQIKLFGPDQLLSSNIFKLSVTKTLSPSSESSKDELDVLVNALGQVQDIDNRFAQTNAQLSDIDNRFEQTNAQLSFIENNQNAIKMSHFGTGIDGLIKSIQLGNLRKIPVDLDVDVTIPANWSLSDMIDVKTDIFSSNGSRISYSKYGIPIFLIRDNDINFGKGMEFYWTGITPSDARTPQSWNELKVAMKFNVDYNYNRNTSCAPVVFLGVDGSCYANFTSQDNDNLIYNCIAFLPASPTSRHRLYIDCVFDGVIFGLNSQNFDGLHGKVKGKRYGNLQESNVAPGHLIYLTGVGDDLPVWSKDIDIYVDDTEAECVTANLRQDDVSVKFINSESMRLFVASNRPHGALDLVGVRDVKLTCVSNRQVNRKNNEYGSFPFRLQSGNFNHQLTNDINSKNIIGEVIYNILNDASERGVLLTGSGSLDTTNIKFLCTCGVNARKAGTLTGNDSSYCFDFSLNDNSVYQENDVFLQLSGDILNKNLKVKTNFLNQPKVRLRFAGSKNIGDVTVIDAGAHLNVDSPIKRIVTDNRYTKSNRVSGASTTPITLPFFLSNGNYDIEIESFSDNRTRLYRSLWILAINGTSVGLHKIQESGSEDIKYTPTISNNVVVVTPNTTMSSNYNIVIVKK